jgi:23S rRNA pseudouridine955/2504/2580 synthase
MSDRQAQGVSHIVVEEEYAGQRIDNFLMRALKGVPRPLVYRIVRRGEVRVNRGRIRQNYRVRAGDVIRVPPLRLGAEQAPGQVPGWLARALEAAVLFEDDALLAINKPSGVAVHGGSGERLGIIEALRSLRPEQRYLELVHRLDKETSGCLLLAKRRSALRAAHAALRERDVDKRYLALVSGQWSARRRRIDAPLQKNVLRSGERIVRVDAAGKAACTLFEVLLTGPECSVVEARPVTGRTHQIRVHAASEGHPIACDERYGDAEFNQSLSGQGLKRLYLHASSLSVPALELSVRAPLDPPLLGVLEKLFGTALVHDKVTARPSPQRRQHSGTPADATRSRRTNR